MPDWTTPKTWETDELVTASDMNAQVRDNVDHLHTRMENFDEYTLNEGSDYTTTSTSFVDVDTTGSELELTITTTKDNAVVLVHFHGTVDHNSTGLLFFDVALDGTRVGEDDGIVKWQCPGYDGVVSFTRAVPVASEDEHTFKLQWRVGSGTGTLYAGAGTANADVHPQFWVKEL